MALYSKPVRVLMKEMADELAATPEVVFTKQQAVSWFGQKYDRVVGQLMRYVAWVKKNLAEPNQHVRGIIVAREISEDLLLACSMVADIELFEYELSLALKRVNETSIAKGR